MCFGSDYVQKKVVWKSEKKNSLQVADVSKNKRLLFLPFSQNNYVLTHYFYDPLQ